MSLTKKFPAAFSMAALAAATMSTFHRNVTFATAAADNFRRTVKKVVKVVKDSYGRRKIQRKQTLYKGGRWNGDNTKRRKFWDKVRSTHSYNPDPRNRHFWHAYARNNTPVVTL